MNARDGLSCVEKNHDQAGLASRFRTTVPEIESVATVSVADLSIEQFQEAYVARNVPVLVKGALTDGWKCMESWDVVYLKETVGHVELPMRVNPSSSGTFGAVERLDAGEVSLYDFGMVRFRVFLDCLGEEVSKYYPARLELCNDVPELIPDVPSFYDLPWRFAFGCPYKNGAIGYFGPGRQTTPLHYDTLENLTIMVAGSKVFKLFPPCKSHLLSPAPRCLGTHYSLKTLKDDEAINALCFEVTLEKGDMLYLPTCWWHGVEGGEGFNISLNYWFCQNREKEDYSAYNAYLEASFERTLEQLRTMRLPSSVLEEAERDATSAIESKMNQRKLFDWQAPV